VLLELVNLHVISVNISICGTGPILFIAGQCTHLSQCIVLCPFSLSLSRLYQEVLCPDLPVPLFQFFAQWLYSYIWQAYAWFFMLINLLYEAFQCCAFFSHYLSCVQFLWWLTCIFTMVQFLWGAGIKGRMNIRCPPCSNWLWRFFHLLPFV